MNTTTNKVRPGSIQWRKDRGLQTCNDVTQRYRMQRHPQGAYRVPLPEDLIKGVTK